MPIAVSYSAVLGIALNLINADAPVQAVTSAAASILQLAGS